MGKHSLWEVMLVMLNASCCAAECVYRVAERGWEAECVYCVSRQSMRKFIAKGLCEFTKGPCGQALRVVAPCCLLALAAT